MTTTQWLFLMPPQVKILCIHFQCSSSCIHMLPLLIFLLFPSFPAQLFYTLPSWPPSIQHRSFPHVSSGCSKMVQHTQCRNKCCSQYIISSLTIDMPGTEWICCSIEQYFLVPVPESYIYFSPNKKTISCCVQPYPSPLCSHISLNRIVTLHLLYTANMT